MKISLILVILLSGCSMLPKVEVSIDDPLVSTNAYGQLLYQDRPFSGYLVAYYLPEGKLKSTAGYLDGRLESESLEFYPSGKLHVKRYYSQGEKVGTHRGYFEDGSLQFEYFFENGMNIGIHRSWYDNGQLAQEMNFEAGQPFGSQKVWRKDGKLRANYVIREDGRRYGLVGIKRCKNIDTEEQRIQPLTAEIYEK